MTQFPRTQIESVSVPRMIIGTNWFMGFSHTSAAQSKFIKQLQGRKQIADVMEVFFEVGINATLGGQPHDQHFVEAVQDVQDRTGQKCIWIGTPSFDLSGTQEAEDQKGCEQRSRGFVGILVQITPSIIFKPRFQRSSIY